MAGTKFRFRWWYLLVLLPLLLYGVANWYVGYRIDQAIARANEGGSTLTVADYHYGFFPIALTARDITFDQRRTSFSANGRLSQLKITGLRAWSLVSGDPIRLRGISLGGLEAQLTRHATPPSANNSSLALAIDRFHLSGTSVKVVDEVNGAQFRIVSAELSVQTLALPFQPAGIRTLQLTADTIGFLRARDATSILLTDLDYTTDGESVTARKLRLQQGDSTDLQVDQLTISGLNAKDLANGISIDSITAERVGGGARVPTNPRRGEPAKLEVQLGKISLPVIDLSITGDFGEVDFNGAISVSELIYSDSLVVKRVSVNGREIQYRKRGSNSLAVTATGAEIDQRDLSFPLHPQQLGQTTITLSKLTVETKELRLAASLTYGSDDRSLELSDLQLSGKRVNGTVSGVKIPQLNRTGLLSEGPKKVPSVTVTGANVTIDGKGGIDYRIVSPTVELTDIEQSKGLLSIARARVQDGQISRLRPNGKDAIVASGIYLDQYAISAPFEVVKLGRSKLRVAKVDIFGEDQPVDYTFSRLSYDSPRGLLLLDSIRSNNQYTADELFRQKIGKSWLDFGFADLRASGIDHAELLRGNLLQLDSLTSRGLRIAVVEDLSLDLPPKDKLMPIEALRKIGPRIVVGTTRLSSAEISYAVVDSVLQPKTIRFGAGDIKLTGLDTDFSVDDSVYVFFDATFEETTPLHAEFVLSRDGSGRNYAVRGQFGSYDLLGINPLFEVAANAIVQSGVIDSMSYTGGLRNDTLTGEFNLLYHDLDLKIVGSGGFLKNLISGLVLKNKNVIGKDFRQGRMYHEHTRDKSFFNAYWRGLVSGMKSSALSDIALRKELD